MIEAYEIVIGFEKNDAYRKSLNDLAQKTFGFTFEPWYQDGYWNDKNIPYSLMDGDTLVSNVSVNRMDFNVFGEAKRYIQLGTVITNPDYRKKGFASILIEKVLADYRDTCDLIYLYATDPENEFYPKFGFKKVEQYQHIRKVEGTHYIRGTDGTHSSDDPVKKLDMSAKHNRTFVYEKIMHAVAVSGISMCSNAELGMFHCMTFMNRNVYYIKKFDAVVIADFAEDKIEVFDIFCSKKIPLNDLLGPLTDGGIKKIALYFTPLDTSSYGMIPLEGEDTLFAMGKDEPLLRGNHFMFPKLSHT